MATSDCSSPISRDALMLESLEESVIATRLDGTILAWSAGAERLYGWSRDEAVGEIVHQLLKTVSLASADEIHNSLLAPEARWAGELQKSRRDGTRITVSSQQQLLTEHNGDQIVIARDRDIAARSRSADSLRRRREDGRFLELSERFRFATEAAEIGYWFCDLPFDKLIWDARVKEHFWLPPDADVDIDLFYQRLHPDDRERTRQAIETSIATHTPYDIEYRTVSLDGRGKWVRAIGRTAYDSIGTPIRFDGITQDITSLKRARQELLSSEDRIRVALQTVDIVLYTTDLDLRYTWMYRAHEAYPAEDILGRRDIDVEPEKFREVHDFKRSVLALGVPGRREIRYNINGKPEIFVYTAEPLRDSNRDIIGLTVAALNVTQMRLAEETLRKTEKLALVGRLAASIAHEINNPLESVVSLLYVARSMATGEELRNYLATAEEELYRVAHIVSHSLRFNRQSTAASEVKVSMLIESALALYRGRLKQSSVQVITQFRDAEPLLCLPSELRQVFANLIGNSFEATRTGKIVLRAYPASDWRTGKSGIRCVIADTGNGIDSQTLEHLFEPFVTTKGELGTGLGLWVSAEILKRHHATVRVRSSARPGSSGTVFSIFFPSSGPPPAPQQDAEPIPPEFPIR